jgi:hypothetical protein
MYEFIPLVAGVAVALLVQPLATAKLRLVALILLSTVCGAIATLISGEILASRAYLVFDIVQALLAAGVTMLARRLVGLHRWRTPPLR